MTKRKYHIAYYTAAQELTGIYRIKLLIGPFASRWAAHRMIMPARNATGNRDDWNIIVHEHKLPIARNLPPGNLDLSLINPLDVIAASL